MGRACYDASLVESLSDKLMAEHHIEITRKLVHDCEGTIVFHPMEFLLRAGDARVSMQGLPPSRFLIQHYLSLFISLFVVFILAQRRW